MLDTIINYVFMFFIFSAVGWAIECTYRSLGERKIINSGFLYGPMCPIYGTGCLVFDICLVPISAPVEKRLIIVLILGMILADTVEYATSYIMEKLFNARWWDYSGNFLNLHGRICFKHTCYWAIFAFVYVYIIAPMYRFALSFIPQSARTIAVLVILAIFTVDLIFTVKAAADINKLMKKLDSLKATVTEKAENIRNTAETTYEAISNGEMFSEWKNEITQQYYEAVEKYKQLYSQDNKITNRLFSMYDAIKKAADDSFDELERIKDEIKSFFTDSDSEMM